MLHEELAIHHNFAQRVIARGADVHQVVKTVQDEWALPQPRLIKSDDEIDRAQPGAHGIPEIARSEMAFYNALTEGQRDAYDAIAALVDELYAKNKSWEGVAPWEIDAPIEAWKANAFLNLATNPMQAFMVGQMLANDFLESPVARPLLPTDRRAIEFLEHYAFNEVGGAFDAMKTVLRAEMIDGMAAGDNPRVVARAIRDAMDDYETNWALIAITENTRAEAQGRLHEMQDADIKYVVGSSAHDSKTCDECLKLIDGQVVKVSDTIGQSNYGRKRKDYLQVIPLHPRCRCVWLPATPEAIAIIRGEA